MSGRTVTERLYAHFDAIRASELARLSKKLNGLEPEHRSEVDAIAADIVRAIAGLPARALQEHERQADVEALARLFALDA